jgi:hypothetical protein
VVSAKIPGTLELEFDTVTGIRPNSFNLASAFGACCVLNLIDENFALPVVRAIYCEQWHLLTPFLSNNRSIQVYHISTPLRKYYFTDQRLGKSLRLLDFLI